MMVRGTPSPHFSVHGPYGFQEVPVHEAHRFASDDERSMHAGENIPRGPRQSIDRPGNDRPWHSRLHHCRRGDVPGVRGGSPRVVIARLSLSRIHAGRCPGYHFRLPTSAKASESPCVLITCMYHHDIDEWPASQRSGSRATATMSGTPGHMTPWTRPYSVMLCATRLERYDSWE
jgi:hypothetical protein